MTAPLHFSALKHIARSPLHYRHALTHPMPDSPAMQRGRWVHQRVLGAAPHASKPFAVWSEGDRRGKAWEAFKAANAHADIVRQADVDAWQPIADAVLASELAAPWLDCPHEVRIAADMHGRLCRGTADAVRQGAASPGFVCDLKTTRDADPAAFARDAWRMHYPAQLAWYLDMANAAGMNVTEAVCIAVDTAAPHAVTVLRLTPAALAAGRLTYRTWLDVLASCEAANVWPGPAQAVVDLDVPAWMAERDDENESDEDEEGEDE